jgi:hypothetical protein
MKSCPKCESARIYRSKRRGIVERIILTMISVRPFRCERCDARFYVWFVSTNPQASRKATPLSWRRRSLGPEHAHVQK